MRADALCALGFTLTGVANQFDMFIWLLAIQRVKGVGRQL